MTPQEFRRYKRRLQRKARKHLCYEVIAKAELEIYQGVWTAARSGKVSDTLQTESYVADAGMFHPACPHPTYFGY